MSNALRKLPPINEILLTPDVQTALAEHPRELVVQAIRDEIAEVRDRFKAGAESDGVDKAQIARMALHRLNHEVQPRLRPVINATGIILHTNLGRAPLAEEAADAARKAACGYLDLELDLQSGKRSSRQQPVRDWICKLTGAESATVVNNNAAATVIVLRAICQAKEAIVSRGQLIEIGGSFRIPDIMSVSGAVLREVGTTNITRITDYENAIGENTGALMQIHTSNYRISGFTKSASLEELVELGKKYGLPVIDDVGSGAMIDYSRFGFEEEPNVPQSLQTGVDLALFSGDKLLGGPQAGIIAGKKELIQRIEKDPLMRAFRLDKMTLAALECTLRIYLDQQRALEQIPVLRMLGVPLEQLRKRATRLAKKIKQLDGIERANVIEDIAYVGGGSLPDQSMPTVVVEIQSKSTSDTELATRLRNGQPAVMPRIRNGFVVLDVRTVFPHQENELVNAVAAVLTNRDS